MNTKTMLIGATSVFIGVAGLVAKPHGVGQAGGTRILHFFVRKAMSPEGTNSNATGFVDAKQNKQGNANNQKLDITVDNLGVETSYELFALLGDDTSFTRITSFDTDGNGAAELRYKKVGSSKRKGKGKSSLPAALDPISNIRELAIVDTSTQTVLKADLADPDKLQNLIKRRLTNEGIEPNAEGSLRIKATENNVQFRLSASGLNPGSNYFLALNGGVVSSNASDTNGELSIDALPAGVPDILDIHQVAIWNSVSNSVLGTTLPE